MLLFFILNLNLNYSLNFSKEVFSGWRQKIGEKLETFKGDASKGLEGFSKTILSLGQRNNSVTVATSKKIQDDSEFQAKEPQLVLRKDDSKDIREMQNNFNLNNPENFTHLNNNEQPVKNLDWRQKGFLSVSLGGAAFIFERIYNMLFWGYKNPIRNVSHAKKRKNPGRNRLAVQNLKISDSSTINKSAKK